MACVMLNVGGKRVQTLCGPLSNLAYFRASLQFQEILKAQGAIETVKSEPLPELFIDADYEIFRHVLNRVRDASYIIEDVNAMSMWNYFNAEETVKVDSSLTIQIVRPTSQFPPFVHVLTGNQRLFSLSLGTSGKFEGSIDFRSKHNSVLQINSSDLMTFFKIKSSASSAEKAYFLRKSFVKLFGNQLYLNIEVDLTYRNDRIQITVVAITEE